ncbi:MAG: PPC domain-containing protein [Desulfarculus sp.]|nr:PPC domain-containing protein [Desulfarculus sp.]
MAADGITGDINTGGVLLVGQSLTGSLEQAGQRAWYRVDLGAGQSYFFALAGGTTGQGSLRDPLLYLYDPAGELITQNDDSGGFINSRLTYTASRAGTYFLGAGAYQDAQRGSFELAAGTYQDDYSAPSPGRLEVGGGQAGELEVLADLDWFSVELTAGSRYTLSARGLDTGQGTLKDPYLYLYDSDGKSLAQADDGGERRDSLLGFTPTASGTFFLAVGAYQGASAGTYRVEVALAVQEKAGGGQDTPPAMAVGGSQAGELAALGEEDRYAVELAAGQTYCFDLKGRSSGQGTLDNPYLYIYGAGGSPLAWDNGGGQGLDSRLVFTPLAGGTYYLGAAALGNAQTGTYTLDAFAVPGRGLWPRDAPASLSAFGARAGKLETAGQRDWVTLALEEASSYLISLEAAPGEGGLSNADFRLRNASGLEVAYARAGQDGGAASVQFSPQPGGAYYVDIGARGENDLGRYLLSIVGRQVEQFNQGPLHGDWSLNNPAQGASPPGVNPLAAAPDGPSRQPSPALAGEAAAPLAAPHQGAS